MGRIRNFFGLNTPTVQVDGVDVVQYTTSQINAAGQTIADVPGQVIQSGAQVSDAVSDASTVAAISGIALAPVTDGASLSLTADALAVGAYADFSSTFFKGVDAVFMGGSKDVAIQQAGKTAFRAITGNVINRAVTKAVVRTGPNVVTAFRSAPTGKFVTNAYGYTVTAAADATKIAISLSY